MRIEDVAVEVDFGVRPDPLTLVSGKQWHAGSDR